MAASIIKVVGLVVLAAALAAPLASAKPYVDAPALDQGTQGSWPATSPYLNFPALEQAIKATVATPNDRAGSQGIGQSSDPIGMGGQYGANLINDAQAAKKRDLQKAKSFTLPLAPDDRPGAATVANAVETPYLSLGTVGSQPSSGGTTPLVVPYLSHGIGVDQSLFSGSPARPDDRAGARPSMPTSVPTSFAAPVSTAGDGFNWGSAGIGVAGLAAIALAIGLLVVLGRRSRHEGVATS